MQKFDVVGDDLFRPLPGQRVISFTKVKEPWGWLAFGSPAE
jgi:hypothetical protein